MTSTSTVEEILGGQARGVIVNISSFLTTALNSASCAVSIHLALCLLSVIETFHKTTAASNSFFFFKIHNGLSLLTYLLTYTEENIITSLNLYCFFPGR